LLKYDYSQLGYYYITICTQNRELCFKDNNIKQIIKKHWLEIPKQFDNVKLDEYIIMPNHIHGIIIINHVGAIHESPKIKRVIRELPLRRDRRQMLLPKIIGKFKMRSAKEINLQLNQSGQSFWQRNYYEHIIRNQKSLDEIRKYIKLNPYSWDRDRNNIKNNEQYTQDVGAIHESPANKTFNSQKGNS